jgi:hypothetical protein
MKYNIIKYDILKPEAHEVITSVKRYKQALSILKHYEVSNNDYYIEYDIIKKSITLKKIIMYYKIAFYILISLIILTAMI